MPEFSVLYPRRPRFGSPLEMQEALLEGSDPRLKDSPLFAVAPRVALIARKRLELDLKEFAQEFPFVGDIEDWGGRMEGTDDEQLIEFAGRVCYNSFGSGRDSKAFHDNVKEVRHGSLWEHAHYTFAIWGVDRFLTHELVRHRLASFSQMSTRYTRPEVARFVIPADLHQFLEEGDFCSWRALWAAFTTFEQQMHNYQTALELPYGETCGTTLSRKRVNGVARILLPPNVETCIILSCGLRELLTILKQRGSQAAASEIRLLAEGMWEVTHEFVPMILNEVEWARDILGIPYAEHVPAIAP